ncbi:response regulator transcription factor [Massilia sp. R798]|uniref:Response regulator transcription factor n=2 Tax=Massilia soli TaxID=2792854 RepID=A0ABS7SRG9_9BURK|nr:response regulator transcription factor [Massilia soli]
MLVDDHKTMLWGLERLIGGERTGMKVVASASNRAEALAQAAACSPDVILLDLDLNGDCSLDFLPALLVSGVSRALVFSGTRDQAMLDRAILAGARGVLRKDAPAEVVLRAIDKIHQGELWIDHEMMARLFGHFTRPRPTVKADPEAEKIASLTARERAIVSAITNGNGMTNKALAQSLFISEHTLRNYLVSIYKKLGVNNRLELYVYAVRHPIAHAAC